MKPSNIFALVGNGFTYLLTMIQANQVFQVIELVLAVATSLVILAHRIWSWFKEAKEDGKITKDEMDQLYDIVEDGKEEIHEIIKKDHEEK